MIRFILSQVKFKICELATGNRYTEEWNVLPDDSPIIDQYDTEDQTILDKNFVLINFDLDRREYSAGELLILNLVTRQPFWIKGENLEIQIRAKVSEPFDWNSYVIQKSTMLELEIKPNEIQLKHRFVMFDDGDNFERIYIGKSWII